MANRFSKPIKKIKQDEAGVYKARIQAHPVQPADAVSLKESLKIRKREKESRNG